MFFIALRLRLPFPHVTEHCDHWVQSQLSLQDYEINQTNIQKIMQIYIYWIQKASNTQVGLLLTCLDFRNYYASGGGSDSYRDNDAHYY